MAFPKHYLYFGGFFLLFLPFFFFFGSLLGKNFCLQFGQTTEWDDLLNAAHVQSTSLWDTTQLPGLLCNTQEKEELERTSSASLRGRRTGETEGEEAEKEYQGRSLNHQPTMRTHSTQGDRSIQQMWSEQESVMTAMCKQGSSSTNTKKLGIATEEQIAPAIRDLWTGSSSRINCQFSGIFSLKSILNTHKKKWRYHLTMPSGVHILLLVKALIHYGQFKEFCSQNHVC